MLASNHRVKALLSYCYLLWISLLPFPGRGPFWLSRYKKPRRFLGNMASFTIISARVIDILEAVFAHAFLQKYHTCWTWCRADKLYVLRAREAHDIHVGPS